MAFNPIQINPLDLKPGYGIGISIPFNSPSVFTTTYTTANAIQANLLNFFLTNKNEIYLNPTFGGSLRAFLFEQIEQNNLDSFKTDIQNLLNIYFPTVIVNSLDVVSNINENSITVSLNYSISNTNINDNLQIVLLQ